MKIKIEKTILMLMLLFDYLAATSLVDLTTDQVSEINKKYYISACATFKNKASVLKEWIEYHKNLGVEHFYLYNLASTDAFEQILMPFINEGSVTLVNWPEICTNRKNTYEYTLFTKVPAYENAINFISKSETEWMILSDVDEYLVCSNRVLKELLDIHKDFAIINLHPEDGEKGIYKNTFDLIKKQELVSKVIIKPDLCEGFSWAPYQCCPKEDHFTSIVPKEELVLRKYSSINKHTLLTDYSKFDLTDDHLSEEKYHLRTLHKVMYPTLPSFINKLNSWN